MAEAENGQCKAPCRGRMTRSRLKRHMFGDEWGYDFVRRSWMLLKILKFHS